MEITTMIDTSRQDVNVFPIQLSYAAQLGPEQRKDLAIEMLARTEPVTHLADKAGVSRKFLYQQAEKADNALDQAFSDKPKSQDQDVLFFLPITKAWLQQFILALIFHCHSSYGGVIRCLQDLLDVKISVGTIHNTVYSVVGRAKEINAQQDLSPIRNGIHDEQWQAT